MALKKQNKIQITESDVINMVNECVRKYLSENDIKSVYDRIKIGAFHKAIKMGMSKDEAKKYAIEQVREWDAKNCAINDIRHDKWEDMKRDGTISDEISTGVDKDTLENAYGFEDADVVNFDEDDF